MFIDKRVEVGNHSYDFHSNNHGRNGSKRNSGESEDTYKNIICCRHTKSPRQIYDKNRLCTDYIYIPFRCLQ